MGAELELEGEDARCSLAGGISIAPSGTGRGCRVSRGGGYDSVVPGHSVSAVLVGA